MKTHRDMSSLLDVVRKLPGKKILTLLPHEGTDHFKIDVSKNGYFGYHPTHMKMFTDKLEEAFATTGVLMIRQFLPTTVETTVANGKRMKIPEKNVYGVLIQGGQWQAVEREVVMEASLRDFATGLELSPEAGVYYCDLPLEDD